MPGGLRVEVHLSGAETGGAFCLLVDHPVAGWGLPPHKHTAEAETIHVVEGEYDMVVDGRELRVGPGETVHVPAGVTHSGALVGEGPGRRVLMFSPAGMEGFFLEAGAPGPQDPVDLEKLLGAAARYGWEFAGA
jgi:uncharacterized RmlC-like cupin family protein